MDIENGFARCLFSFFLGVLFFNFSTSIKLTLPRSVPMVTGAAVIALLTFVPLKPDSTVSLAFPFLFAGLIFTLHHSPSGGVMKDVLENRRLVHLGTISYGVYMIPHRGLVGDHAGAALWPQCADGA